VKDLNLSRVINVVALTGLALTVAGCGGDRSAARKVCKATQKCDKSDFEDEYSSMGDCVDTMVEYLEDIEDQTDEDCAQAVREFMVCGAKAYRADCDYDDIENDCEDQAEDVVDDCDFSLSYDDYDY
jgi:hypothetical protein